MTEVFVMAPLTTCCSSAHDSDINATALVSTALPLRPFHAAEDIRSAAAITSTRIPGMAPEQVSERLNVRIRIIEYIVKCIGELDVTVSERLRRACRGDCLAVRLRGDMAVRPRGLWSCRVDRSTAQRTNAHDCHQDLFQRCLLFITH
jgi:hypothetical protein